MVAGCSRCLQKIREQLNGEFERYRCDTEESMKRTLGEMKMRLDQRLRENQRLQEEKDRLDDMLAKMKGELNQIQSQVQFLNPCGKGNRRSARRGPAGRHAGQDEGRTQPDPVTGTVHKPLLGK